MHTARRFHHRPVTNVKDLKIQLLKERVRQGLRAQHRCLRGRKDHHSRQRRSQHLEAALAISNNSRSTRYSNSKYNRYRVSAVHHRKQAVKREKVWLKFKVCRCIYKGAKIAQLIRVELRTRSSKSNMKTRWTTMQEKFQHQYQDNSKVESTATV